MFKKKYLFYLIISIVSLFFSLKYGKQWLYHKNITENTHPISCNILFVDCSKSRGLNPHCNIEFNGFVYNRILVSKCDTLKLGLNKYDFYYDKKNDIIINKNYDYSKLFIGFSVLSLVFLLITIRSAFYDKKQIKNVKSYDANL